MNTTRPATTTPTPRGTRVAVYLRQSRDADDTRLAVTRQLDACQTLCDARGWTVAGVFTENNVSGSGSAKRPEFDRMMGLAAAGRFEMIVAYHLDRLTRNMADLERIITDAQKHGYTIATAAGDIDLSTDMGRLVGRILGSVATGEIERKGRRQKDAARQKAEQGRPHIGPKPFGYARDGVTILPDEAAAVKQAYADTLTGRSLSAVGKEWTEAGFTTSRGGPWTHNAVRSLLLNPRNAGLRAYRHEIIGQAAWPALVAEDVWRSVVALIEHPDRRRQNGTARRWLLAGLAECGVCADGTKMMSGYRDAGGPENRIYKCAKAKHLVRKAAPIDDFAERLVIGWVSRPEASQILINDTLPNIDALRLEATALRQRKQQIAVLLATDPNMTPSQFQTANDHISDRLASVEREMVNNSSAPVLAELIEAADPWAAWDALELDQQRTALAAICTLIVNRGKPGNKPFDPRTVVPQWA